MADGKLPSDRPAPQARASWRGAKGLAVCYAAGIAAGLGFLYLSLPLPWLLGPLALAIALAAADRPLAQPIAFVHPMRSFIGVAVGSSFGPDILAKAGSAIVSLTLLVPYTFAITWTGYLFLTRVARFDKPTAYFGASPGGLADMIMFAQDAGADLRRVTLIQAARVVTIVFTLPFWLQFVGGMPLGGAMPKALHIWQITVQDAGVICLLAWGGWALADKIGLSGGSVVGPMLLSGIVHALGLTATKVPLEVVVLAQVTIGVTIGATFRGISLYELIGTMSWGLAYAVLLLVIAGAAALGISMLTGLDATSLLLSYAPGGQNEMAIIGLILGVDVALISMHHLLRVVIVVTGAQLVLKSIAKNEAGKPGA
jgi:uncharacterized protein